MKLDTAAAVNSLHYCAKFTRTPLSKGKIGHESSIIISCVQSLRETIFFTFLLAIIEITIHLIAKNRPDGFI